MINPGVFGGFDSFLTGMEMLCDTASCAKSEQGLSEYELTWLRNQAYNFRVDRN